MNQKENKHGRKDEQDVGGRERNVVFVVIICDFSKLQLCVVNTFDLEFVEVYHGPNG